MMVCGEDSARTFLRQWLADKTDIVLVTGRVSYSKCGAETFLSPFLDGKRVTHLTTVGENARAEDVAEKRSALPPRIDAFIAVGGGTVLDTTKLLRNGFPDAIRDGAPYLAVPTTAGTGAEATRFAVYYDRGTKMSADDERYLPTEVVLLPEFTVSQSDYQRSSTEFDAYAQAVESLWAKGATDESLSYAWKALELMSSGQQMLGSYWAGRAIDISRTTAAHALSYYMTATYGIPHGHAVYMMFPYILRNNAAAVDALRKKGLKVGAIETVLGRYHRMGLSTLREFAEEKSLDWSQLVDELFAHVNLKRLENNPVEVRKASFAE